MGNKEQERTSDAQLSDHTFTAVGAAVHEIGMGLAGARSLQIELVGINIKRPQQEHGEFLAVVKGLDAEGVPCVAFHSGFTLGELMRGLAGRIRNGSLKWREDQYMQ